MRGCVRRAAGRILSTMTLRLEQVAGQLPGLVARYKQQLEAMNRGIDAAEAAAREWAADPDAGNRRIEQAMASATEQQPYATVYAGESPAAAYDPPPFAPVTVVAADGSSIEPDRFAAVQCYVLNTGAVVLPYGTGTPASLGSVAAIGPELPPDEAEDEAREDTAARSWGVNLRRDVCELEAGAAMAAEAVDGGPVVLLLDGTLLPWDLDSRQIPQRMREDLAAATREALDGVAALGADVSMGAYISTSRSRDVVTSLRALAPGEQGSWPLADSQVFGRLLQHGQRSAVFRARSERTQLVEKLFQPAHQVCFFYLRYGADIARVEVPHWATDSVRLGRLHATLVNQCDRCGGYPRALQEAHEQAVISGGDRQQFSILLEREADRHGLLTPANSKQMSKRRRAL